MEIITQKVRANENNWICLSVKLNLHEKKLE